MQANSTRIALAWSFGERYAGLLIAIGSTVILSRLLTPEEVGIYSLCAAFAAVAGILRDFGVSEYLIQEPLLDRRRVKAALGIAIVTAWTIGTCVFLSRHALAEFYEEPGIAEVLAVLALHFVILPLSSPTFALMNRELAFRQIFGLQLACNLAQALTTIGLAWSGHGFLSLAWGPIVNVGSQTVILALTRPRDMATMPSFDGARCVLQFGSSYVASRTIETFARNFHEPVIAKQFDFAAVGLFSRAFGLVDLFNLNVAAAIIRVATPTFAEVHRAGQPLAPLFARATSIFTCIAWPFFVFVALCSHEIIAVMFGPQWTSAAPIASVLAMCALPGGLIALVPQMLSATGHVNRRLQVTLWTAPMHMLGIWWAAHYELVWVAGVWLISGTVAVLMYSRHLHQALGVNPTALFGSCGQSALVALASTGAQCTMLFWARSSEWPDVLTIPAVAAAGSLAWGCTARALGHPAFGECERLWRTLRRRTRSNG